MIINIVTPTYNAAEHISQTANSIAKIQSQRSDIKTNWIVLDNNSVDNTVKILGLVKYQFININLIVEKDNGIYDAMNKGLDLCETGHVLFLGAGDKILTLPKNIEPQVVYYGTTIVDNNRYFVSSIDNFVFNTFSSLHHQSMLVPVSFHRYFNTDYKICADYAHNIEMMIEGREFKFDVDLLSYHMPGGVSSNLEKVIIEHKIIQQRVIQLANKNEITGRI